MADGERDVLGGRYRLEEVVGEGGMALVWRARDLLLDRDVAVKVLREQYAGDPEFLARFRAEARMAAALNDPGVVSVHDVGEDGGRHYLVMEYVPGRDLKAIIREDAPLPPQRAVAIAMELARSVTAAHRVGMVHRDIKPQNVLVTPEGRMKVADFGIARAISAVGMTTPGLVLGTVHYISPEQAAGLPATPASDVYSLGVVLYEMLSGQVPFDAESSVGVAMRILGEDPAPVQQLNPRVPPALAAIVGKAMARRPEDRYPDAGALADALSSYALRSEQVTGALPESAVAGRRPQRAAATPTPERAAPRPGLDRTGLALGLVTFVAVGGLIPLWLAVLARVETAPVLLPTRRPTATPTQAGPAPTVDATAAVSGISVPVPAVQGLDAADARNRLEAAGFGVTEPREPSDTVPVGRVIEQRPAASELIPKGSIVEMTVSQGPAIRVPSVTGDYTAIADALLALGFEPVRRDRWSGAGGQVGQVLGLDPPPGTMWPAGSPVQVNVDSGSWMPIGADFENGLHLRGIDLPRVQVAPGDTLSFVSTWEAVSPIAGDFMARAVLISPDGQEISRMELPPGDRPTSTWQPGERFTSARFDLAIDGAAPPGEYGLWLEVSPVSDPASTLAVRSRGLARSVNGAQLLLAPIQVG